jgi:N6-adenosine-specific RNA methylase IME4
VPLPFPVAPFGLGVGQYRTILADPPWHFKNYSAKGEAKGPSAQHRTMTVPEILALPVGQLAAEDSLLLMWATASLLDKAIECVGAWGFTYKTAAAWAKQSSTGRAWAFGTGYLLRSAAEFIVVGTKGRPPILSRSQRNLLVAPVRQHSRKPDEQYQMAESIGAAPYVELFSRSARPGWDCWGDEAGKFATEDQGSEEPA